MSTTSTTFWVAWVERRNHSEDWKWLARCHEAHGEIQGPLLEERSGTIAGTVGYVQASQWRGLGVPHDYEDRLPRLLGDAISAAIDSADLEFTINQGRWHDYRDLVRDGK